MKDFKWHSVRLDRQLTKKEQEHLTEAILDLKLKELLLFTGKFTQKKEKVLPVKKIKIESDLIQLFKELDVNIRKLINHLVSEISDN